MKQTWPPRSIHHHSSEAHPSRRANADIHFAPVPLGWTVIGRSPWAGLPKQRGAFTLGRRNALTVRPDISQLCSGSIETGVIGPKDAPCRLYVKRFVSNINRTRRLDVSERRAGGTGCRWRKLRCLIRNIKKKNVFQVGCWNTGVHRSPWCNTTDSISHPTPSKIRKGGITAIHTTPIQVSFFCICLCSLSLISMSST